MLTLHPIDRNREIRPIRLTVVRRVPTRVLALAMSAAAALTSGVLSATTDVSGGSLVLGTLAVGFAASWVNTSLPARRS